MLALSVRFPAAGWIAQGLKTIEVRSWSTRHRGKLLIVSSKLRATDARDPLYAGVPSGCALCVVEVTDCRPMRRSDAKPSLSAYAPGLFAWCIELLYHTTAAPIVGKTKFHPVDDHLIRRARPPRWLFA